MENPIIFRIFQTYKNFYVYDRHSNSIITISSEEYDELLRVEKGYIPTDESPVISKYQKQGLFHPNNVQAIYHPNTDVIEHNTQKRMKQLILQVTQQCNLRCEYCAYSGIYNGNRTHANQCMNFDTARKAIDFFFEHSAELSNVSIGFYGGEPLLEFELIKKCVEYINEINEGKYVRFSLTTNGTLLTGEIADFFVKHDFHIGVSLDGSKEEHDVNRKFANGKGSFDVIMNNIKSLSKNHLEYQKNNVNFFTTVNPYMNLGCVLEYFSSSELIDDNSIMFNTMVPKNLKLEINYEESYFQVRNFEYVKTLFMMVGKLDKKYVSRLASDSVGTAMQIKKELHSRTDLESVTHHGGPCQPGVLRLFVRVDGKFFPCERVNENLDYYNIGSVEDGLYLDEVKKLLNIGTLTENECKECWNLRHCLMCSNEIEFHGKDKPSKIHKLEECKTSKNNSEFNLYEQCVLKEFGYTMNTEVM